MVIILSISIFAGMIAVFVLLFITTGAVIKKSLFFNACSLFDDFAIALVRVRKSFLKNPRRT